MWCPISPFSLAPSQGEPGPLLSSGLGLKSLGAKEMLFPPSDRRREDAVRVPRSLLEGCRIPTVVLQGRPTCLGSTSIPTAVLQSTWSSMMQLE